MNKTGISVRVKSTVVRLTSGVSARIDGLVGPRRRAGFIRNAVTKELRRREARRTKR